MGTHDRYRGAYPNTMVVTITPLACAAIADEMVVGSLKFMTLLAFDASASRTGHTEEVSLFVL